MVEAQTFIECHYFKSGFKSVFIGDGQRPSFLPSAESVGLSNEVQLKNSDYAVEVVRRDVGAKLTWIGVYKASVDLDYGDRGNYCGFGVWLVDRTPIHIDTLIKSLLNLLSFIGDTSPSESSISSVKKFHSDYLDKCLISNLSIPDGCSGMPYFKDRYDSNRYLRIESNSALGQSMLANSIISMLFSKNIEEFNRILYLVGNASKANVSPLNEINPATDVDYHENILKSLLAYNSDAINRDKANEKKFTDLSNEKNNAISLNKRLTVESENHVSMVNRLEREIADLKNKPNTSTTNNNSDISSKLDALINKTALSTNRLETIEKNLRKIEDSLNSKIIHTDAPPIKSEFNNSFLSKLNGVLPRNKKTILYSFILMVLISLVGFFIYDHHKKSEVVPIDSESSSEAASETASENVSDNNPEYSDYQDVYQDVSSQDSSGNAVNETTPIESK